MKKTIIAAALGIIFPYHSFADFILNSNTPLKISIANQQEEVVNTALAIFSKDYKSVFGSDIIKDKKATVFIGTLNDKSGIEKHFSKAAIDSLKSNNEAFIIEVKKDKLYILGSDKRGSSYGILELSRLIGVSPWEWWADSKIEKKQSFKLANGFKIFKYPSVKHRGIFLNDEDFALMPWSSQTYEPTTVKGEMGPKTHARIFELLLRLRANTFWPAMHDVTKAFYFTPGNKEMADKYGIFLGTSHCEPMMRNTNAEWKTAGTGSYDYVNNKTNVLNFWEERVKELTKSDNIYTLGIRGVHDGKMQGANTLQEQKDALTDIIKEQRKMLAKIVNPNVEQISQVFIPYKEVLDVYNMGLEVPDDVSLIWCDDNYGYIKHFPTAQERARKGGNGIYYHASYWGRPHDYLWLSTNHPALVYTQMKAAYDKGANNLWVLNVGDIKPSEYIIELFLDMAWDINAIENNKQGIDKHLENWLSREFGAQNAKELLPIMNEFYRLAYIRKPEFMGNTRTEEKDPAYKLVKDLPWSENQIKQRLADYEKINNKVIQLSKNIATAQQDAWFQLIEYPVRAASEMNKKHLYAQLARHQKSDWQLSDNAYQSILNLTDKYNNLGNGKWNKMMNEKPRNLAVYLPIPKENATAPLVQDKRPLVLFNGLDYHQYIGQKPLSHGLGYNNGAVSLAKNSSIQFKLDHTIKADSVWVEVALAPNHPVEGKLIRYGISFDNDGMQTLNYYENGRTERWKENVLTNQTKRSTLHLIKANGTNNHMINIMALDEGVVIDQIKVWEQKPTN